MIPVPGYPQPIGAKTEVVTAIIGPASYVAVVPGVPPTGGQLIQTKDLGLKYLEFAQCTLSDDGRYEALILPATIIAGPNPVPSFRLMWRVAATGAECAPGTVLNTRGVAVRAVGIA